MEFQIQFLCKIFILASIENHWIKNVTNLKCELIKGYSDEVIDYIITLWYSGFNNFNKLINIVSFDAVSALINNCWLTLANS